MAGVTTKATKLRSGSPKFRLGRMTRVTAPRHDFDFITKVGRIDHAGALAMLQRHMGDIEAVFFGTDVLAKALDQPAE